MTTVGGNKVDNLGATAPFITWKGGARLLLQSSYTAMAEYNLMLVKGTALYNAHGSTKQPRILTMVTQSCVNARLLVSQNP